MKNVKEPPHPAASKAFRVVLWGLIPGLGLVLGPVGAVLGMRAWWRFRRSQNPQDRGLGIAAMIFGTGITLSQWIGFYCIFRGIQQLSS